MCSGTECRSCWSGRLGRAAPFPECWTHTRSSSDLIGAGGDSGPAVWWVERCPQEPGCHYSVGSVGIPRKWNEKMLMWFMYTTSTTKDSSYFKINLDINLKRTMRGAVSKYFDWDENNTCRWFKRLPAVVEAKGRLLEKNGAAKGS